MGNSPPLFGTQPRDMYCFLRMFDWVAVCLDLYGMCVWVAPNVWLSCVGLIALRIGKELSPNQSSSSGQLFEAAAEEVCCKLFEAAAEEAGCSSLVSSCFISSLSVALSLSLAPSLSLALSRKPPR